jgi:L-alanine-DL-glutamate epimerase-like enolase superfamily enzyme
VKITGFERTVLRVPFMPGILPTAEYGEFAPPDHGGEPYLKAYPESIERRCQDLLRLHTDEGVTGMGMGSPYYGQQDDTPPDWSGRDPLDFEPRSLVGGGWSMALLDLIGKALDQPMYRLFGGKMQPSIPVDYWIARQTPEDTALAAGRAVEQGFHGLKMKCRWEDGDVVDRVLAALEVAPDLRIVIDPNRRFHTVENTLEIARALEGKNVVIEDPIPRDDFTLYKRLKEETSLPIAPHLASPREAIEVVHLGAADAFNIGPSDWMFVHMARIAEDAGLPVWTASNVDLGLFDVYRLHAALVAPNCTFGSDICGNFVHEHSLLTKPLVENGVATAPEGPGLGVELDEEAVAKYTVAAD